MYAETFAWLTRMAVYDQEARAVVSRAATELR